MIQFNRVVFVGFDNPNDEEKAKLMLGACWGAVPSWVEEMKINGKIHPDFSYARANAEVLPEYARMTLSLGPLWYEDTPFEQLHTILHEVSHFYTSPIYNAAMSQEGAKSFEFNPIVPWLEFCNTHLQHLLWKLLKLDDFLERFENQKSSTSLLEGDAKKIADLEWEIKKLRDSNEDLEASFKAHRDALIEIDNRMGCSHTENGEPENTARCVIRTLDGRDSD